MGLEILEHVLRPPGAGITSFSAGKGSELALLEKHYGCQGLGEANRLWKSSLSNLSSAKVALIGVPSDCGAGIRRGAAYGPRGVRASLLEDPVYLKWIQSGEVLDLGDVLVNPHLLHDEMLSSQQITACRLAMYGDAPEGIRNTLPVSPLSQLERVLNEVWSSRSDLRVYVIGGDHSVAWPVAKALFDQNPKGLGIVQPDAHTDLLEARLGVKYCFGTWSFHANELVKKAGSAFVQVGIRQSGKDRSHWESRSGVTQYWADEINSSGEKTIDSIVGDLKKRGVSRVYFSNDIDGTDEGEAAATGTPAAEGVSSGYFLALIERLGREFELVAADVVEVAPDLGPTPEAAKATCNLAARYTVACLKGMVF